jgi:excisionase family DNA binding protein
MLSKSNSSPELLLPVTGVSSNKKPVSSAKFVPEPLLDSVEAAAIIRIHPKTLQRLARKGLIRGVQVGKLWRFRASEIDSWIQQNLTG